MDEPRDLFTFVAMLALTPLFAVAFVLGLAVVVPVLVAARVIGWARGRA